MALSLSGPIRKFARLKETLPAKIANDAQRFYLKGFDSEQWDGKRWRPRIAKGSRMKKKDITRKLLVNTGTLRRAVSNIRREETFDRIRFEVFVQSKDGYNYAQVHNDGLGNMPQRKFLGESKLLTALIRKKILRELVNVFK